MNNQETLNVFDELYYATYADVLNQIQKNNELISKSYIVEITKNKVV